LLACYHVHPAKPVIPMELIAVVATLSGRTSRVSRPRRQGVVVGLGGAVRTALDAIRRLS